MSVKSSLRDSIFRTGIRERSWLDPLPAAAVLGVVYIILTGIYILVSGRIAAGLAADVGDLQHIETIKGILFVTVTGLGLFVGALFLFRRIAERDSLVIAQHKSIAASEQLVMTGLFSAALCHDINNIMSVVMANAELLNDSANLDEEDRRSLEQINAASGRLVSLVDRMMTMGRGHMPGQHSNEDLAGLVREIIDFARIHEKVRHCDLVYKGPRNFPGRINPVLLTRALMNMLINAADATGGRGRIEVRLEGEGGRADIEVHDDGPGVAPEARERIFEPFFTSKRSGNGLGLLSLRTAAEQHGGSVELADSPLGGACFRLRLPNLAPSPA